MAQATPGTNYTVQSGDSLFSIAQRAYGDGNQWQKIYQANSQVIGSNPDLIRVGEVLFIPVLGPTPGANYTVQSGDSLFSIAQQAYGDGNQWQKIYQANRQVIGPNPSIIQPGQVLFIPPQHTATTYTVQPGDSLFSIAQHFYGDGNQWQKIYQANRQVIGPNPSIIQSGQVLTIP